MGLVSLTQTSSGNSFSLEENDVLKVYDRNSQTVVEYVSGELSRVVTQKVDSSTATVAALFSNLVSTTYNGGTIYLNSNRVVSVEEVNSLAWVAYDNNGDKPEILKLDVSKSTFEAGISSLSDNFFELDTTLTQAQVRTLNTANGGYGIELIASPGADKIIMPIEPPVARWDATGGAFVNATLWFYYYSESDPFYASTQVAAYVTPINFIEIPYLNNIKTAAGDGSDGQYPSTSGDAFYIYSSAEHVAYEGTLRIKMKYRIIDLS